MPGNPEASAVKKEPATWRQGMQIQKVVMDQDSSKDQIESILRSGFLSDLAGADPKRLSTENRNQIALLLGAKPYDVFKVHRLLTQKLISKFQVDYDTPLSELVKWFGSPRDPLPSNVDTAKKSGTDEVSFSLLGFKRDMPVDLILKFMERDGYLPINLRELIAFSKRKEICRPYNTGRIIALGQLPNQAADFSSYPIPYLQFTRISEITIECNLKFDFGADHIIFSGCKYLILVKSDLLECQ